MPVVVVAAGMDKNGKYGIMRSVKVALERAAYRQSIAPFDRIKV
jgi:hypothetical protein